MKRFRLIVALLTGCGLSAAADPAGSLPHDPQTALFELRDAGTWSAGFGFDLASRELSAGGASDNLDTRRLRVFVTHAPWSWLTLSAGLGAAEAKFIGPRGEYGLDWSVGARLGLVEQVLQDSPVRGRTRLLRFDLGTDFRRGQSDHSSADLSWTEWRLLPQVTYLESLTRHMGYRLLHADVVMLHAGLVFSRLDARYQGVTWRESRDFGLRLGGGIQLLDGVTLFADTVWYRTSENVISAGMSRRF